jgi:hypothetical protein
MLGGEIDVVYDDEQGTYLKNPDLKLCGESGPRGEDDELEGLTVFDERKIVMGRSFHDDVIRNALFHELIHLADATIAESPDMLSERQVLRVGAVMFSILSDNPHLVEWLFGATKKRSARK